MRLTELPVLYRIHWIPQISLHFIEYHMALHNPLPLYSRHWDPRAPPGRPRPLEFPCIRLNPLTETSCVSLKFAQFRCFVHGCNNNNYYLASRSSDSSSFQSKSGMAGTPTPILWNGMHPTPILWNGRQPHANPRIDKFCIPATAAENNIRIRSI